MTSRLVLPVLVAATLLLPSVASASVLGGTLRTTAGCFVGEPASQSARSIKSVNTTFDNQLGRWSTTVTFDAPQTAKTQAKLYFGLADAEWPSGAPYPPSASVSAWTDPSSPRTTYHLSAGGTPAAVPPPSVTTTFSSDATSVTITVVDQALIGQPLDNLGGVRLSRRNIHFDNIPSFNLLAPGTQPTPPELALPSGDHHLALRAGAINVQLGDYSHAWRTSGACLEIGRKVVARGAGIGSVLPSHGVETIPMAPVAGGTALRPGHGVQAATLTAFAYSLTGALREVSIKTEVST